MIFSVQRFKPMPYLLKLSALCSKQKLAAFLDLLADSCL
jgi:hypothetical protein